MEQFHKTVTEQRKTSLLLWLGLILLVAVPRLTNLGDYLIVDEADRWQWAKDFVMALQQGNLAATMVGDGYPGIVPVWAETIWIFLEAIRRSWQAGQWIGQDGIYLLLHQWERIEALQWQRLPIVLLNTVIALAIIVSLGRLFGKKMAFVSGLLIALDPFYLSDSRVNRAEALITGLMTLSVLGLVFYAQRQRYRYLIFSAIFAGLSFLTKIQAVVLIPAVLLIISWILYFDSPINQLKTPAPMVKIKNIMALSLLWLLTAGLTWLLLWPSMWVIPLETLTLVYNYATRKVGAEGVNLFFWGQTYQDANPGLWFYPFVFIMRITPLTMLGGLAFMVQWRQSFRHDAPLGYQNPNRYAPILIIYIVIYALVMTLGSHKQDRYLMPIFLCVDILAAMGLLYLEEKSLRIKSNIFLPILLLIQIATIYPHHPYYYSYFNPLLGGGQTAMRTLRVGWGEGMDLVGAYLATKPHSRELVVSSRFADNMLGFKGKIIGTGTDGRWTKANYIVLYIQQVQRRQEPSPAFFDYFQARTPEKIITIGGIDYAWIYPIPFDLSANPQISVIPDQIALLGYSWEKDSVIRLWWENLGMSGQQSLMARLVGATTQTKWTLCHPAPNFTRQAKTLGQYVESLCLPKIGQLPPDSYTVEFALGDSANIEPIPFPEGQQAMRLTATDTLTYTAPNERFDLIAQQALPANASRSDRYYDQQLRLLAYELNPAMPTSAEPLTVTLYWQAVQEMARPLTLTVKIADSRLISLGREEVALPATRWLNGTVSTTHHSFTLPPDLVGLLAAQVEISLVDGEKVSLKATNLVGEPLENELTRFTISPQKNSIPSNPLQKVNVSWQNEIVLLGYTLSANQPTWQVNLFWEAKRPITESYFIFVHLVNELGQIVAQNDSLPGAGTYPTPWWQAGLRIEDNHALILPADLPAGNYQLWVGLYDAKSMVRLPLMDKSDSFLLDKIEVQ